MKDIGIVQGSQTQAQPLVIGTDTVYMHTDIVKLDTDSMGNVTDSLYRYHEVQYGKDEYIALISNQQMSLQTQVFDLTTQLVTSEVI